MRRVVVLGGTGAIGRAVGRRLLLQGWQVDLVARDPAMAPADLVASGARFVAGDRSDADVLRSAVAPGADLVVDAACFTARQARAILPLLTDVGALVMISSKAVYIDDAGNHSNSAYAPRFDGPVTESQPTVSPSESDDFNSREGYGACKVAAERALLDSGHAVTVLRPSKIHGIGARKPCEWAFVKRVLDERALLPLAHRGLSADQTSAATNIAALVDTVSGLTGGRVLNAADPDAPTTRDIARIVADHLHWKWDERLLGDDVDPSIGRHPWHRWPPVRLDMRAAIALGYRPAGDYRSTVAETLDWLVDVAEPGPRGVRLPDAFDNEYFDSLVDYPAEDAVLPKIATPGRLETEVTSAQKENP